MRFLLMRACLLPPGCQREGLLLGDCISVLAWPVINFTTFYARSLWERLRQSVCKQLASCLPLQAAKEKDYWKEMSDASLERIRTTYTWCAHLPLLS